MEMVDPDVEAFDAGYHPAGADDKGNVADIRREVAFALFRFFDIAKPGPIGWADNLFHGENPATTPWGWTRAGWAIMLDDLVAAACTLLVIALWRVW